MQGEEFIQFSLLIKLVHTQQDYIQIMWTAAT